MSATNVKQFNKEILTFARSLTPNQLRLFYSKLALDMLRGVVMRTPVDTGRARGNWQVSLDQPVDGELEGVDQSGSRTIENGAKVIQGAGQQRNAAGQFLSSVDPSAFRVIWISNNVAYIQLLESGSSKQAPSGMVRRTIEELRKDFQ